MEQRLHIGDDGWEALSAYLGEIAAGSVLLVTGRGMFTASGAEAALVPALEGKRVRRVCEFETNPKAEDVDRILGELSADDPYDVIVAIGGGSVMDVGKLLKAFWGAEHPVASYLRGEQAMCPASVPLVAIPSTAGSGSESTHFAVAYDGKTKYSVADAALLPEFAIVIPALLESVPRHVAAASGLDALCQGIESYWSIHSSEASRALAGEAITLAWASLDAAVNRCEPDALAQIARASNLAGQAINFTKTTAPHAVSYPFASFYGVQHGHAVGLLLPGFMKFNAGVTEEDTLDGRGAAWVQERLAEIAGLMGCDSPDAAAGEIRQLTKQLGLETDLAKLGIIGEAGLEVIVANGFNPQRVNNNPRRVTESHLWDLLHELAELD